jgi:hypothetical protein
MKLIASLMFVFTLTVGVTGVLITTDAVTHTEQEAEALSNECILALTGYGLSVVYAYWSPPPIGLIKTFVFAAIGLTTSASTVFSCMDTLKYWYSGKTRGCDFQNTALINVPVWSDGSRWDFAGSMIVAPKRDAYGTPYLCGPCPYPNSGFLAKYPAGCGGGGGGGGSW